MKISNKYTPARGSQFNKKQAQRYGQCLQGLADKYEHITPTLVVKEAQKKKSPLHNYFDWEDATAAHKHRLWQARILLNHIRVKITFNSKETDVRQFHNIVITPEAPQETAYVTLNTVVESADYVQQVLKQAFKEVKEWKARYQQYGEYLQPIFDAIADSEHGAV